MKPAELITPSHTERLYRVLDLSWKVFKSQFVGRRYNISNEAGFQLHFSHIIMSIGNLFCLDRNDDFLLDLETKCEDVRGRDKHIDLTCSFRDTDVRCAIELKFKKKDNAPDVGRIEAYSDLEALELVCEKAYYFGRFYMITQDTAYINPSSYGLGTVLALHDGFRTQAGRRLNYENHLFDITPFSATDLNSRQVPDEMRARLREHEKPLTQQAQVIVNEADANWIIVDRHRIYAIRRENLALSVYKKRFRDDITLKSEYTFQWEKVGAWYFLEVQVEPSRVQTDAGD